MWTKNFQMFKLNLEKAEEPRDQIATTCWIIEKARELKKKIHFYFIDYAKAFDCVDHNKLWKIFQEMGMPDHLTCLLRNLFAVQEATVRASSKLGKEYIKAVYCHHTHLTYVQSTSWEMLRWMKYKLESKLLEEI